MSRDPYEVAKQRVHAKKGFFSHLSVYLAINISMTCVVYFSGDGFDWLMVALMWGIALMIHGFFVLGLPGIGAFGSKEWEEKQINKELRKQGYEVDDNESFQDELDLRELRNAPRNLDRDDFV